MILAINASRARSGGAITHLIGFIGEMDPEAYGFKMVHVWTYQSLAKELPHRPWLIKHSPALLDGGIIKQVLWEWLVLPIRLKGQNCRILLNIDGGTFCRFKPSVTMSRDMLSYEPGEIDRFAYSKAWLRLLLLRYIQNASFRAANGVIFLTHYAAEVIQKYCGILTNIAYIPHGVSAKFFLPQHFKKNLFSELNAVSCLYISNISLYKHQWKVIEAISLLRTKGWDIRLVLTGGGVAGGASRAQKLLDCAISIFDPNAIFIKQLGYVMEDDLPKLISKSDIFIFASSCENMPNTLIQAMSVGVPIACSDRGPMKEVLQDGGVYFDPEKPDTIALAIENLLNDQNLRHIVSSRARDLASQYTWKRCANETLAFLVAVLKK